MCGRLIAGIAGSNSSESMDSCLLCCVSIDTCDELITRSEESYRACVSNVCGLGTSGTRRSGPDLGC